MDLNHLVGLESGPAIGELEAWAREATAGTLARVLVHQGARSLIVLSQTALEQAQGELQALEQDRAGLDEQRAHAESALVDARAVLQKASLREAQAGTHGEAWRQARTECTAASEESERLSRDYDRVTNQRRALVQGAIPAAEGEVRRLEALIGALGGIEAPEVGDLRAALQAVI